MVKDNPVRILIITEDRQVKISVRDNSQILSYAIGVGEIITKVMSVMLGNILTVVI